MTACGSAVESDHEEEDHHSHAGEIVISPQKAAEFGIETQTVTPATFSDVIKTWGTIEASPSDIFTATAKKSGIVSLTPGINVTTPVKAGERLATIKAEGMQGGDAVKASSANLRAAKAEYERLKPLFEEKLVTASVFREAERAYHEAEALAGHSSSGGTEAVTSPSTGNILELYVKSGDYVEAGAPVATIGKNVTQILRAELPLRLASHASEIVSANFIPEGSGHTLKLTALSGKKISQQSSPVTPNGYIPVVFSFSGTPLTSHGGNAQVFLICGEREGIKSLPISSLVEIQGNKYVYVKIDDDEYEKRLVKTGANDGERIEILEGLDPGENVVTKGASIVRMAEVSAVAPPSHNHSH